MSIKIDGLRNPAAPPQVRPANQNRDGGFAQALGRAPSSSPRAAPAAGPGGSQTLQSVLDGSNGRSVYERLQPPTPQAQQALDTALGHRHSMLQLVRQSR